MISEGLYSLLTADAGLSALIAARVYPLGLPQNVTYPCISYTIEEQEEGSDYDGQGDFGGVEIQIDCWADAYLKATQIAAAVKAVLKNYKGDMGGVNVQRLILSASVTVIESKIEKYRTSQVYEMLR